MGGSSDQVTGYKYVTNFLLFIGNPIEKVLGINFDKRGWLTPLIDEMKNPLTIGTVEKPTLYGENEGGVAGQIYAKYGTDNQQVVPFYKDYMDSKELPASAYPFQSYLAFKDFYVGNSGYMKEMLLWPKRTRIRNDGRRQWYEVRGDGAIVCEIGAFRLNRSLLSPATKIINSNTQKTKTIDAIESGTFTDFSAAYTIPDQDNLFLDTIGSGVIGPIDPQMHRKGELALDVSGKLSGLVYVEFAIRIFAEFTSYQLYGKKVYLISEEDVEISPGYPIKEKRIKYIMDASESQKIGIKAEAQFAKHWVSNTDACFFEVIMSVSKYRGEYDDVLVDGADINPVHKIREILTDDTAMNKPESSVNDLNFMKAADRIYDEGLGISWSITEKSCIDAINELCYHIEAGIRVNRQTGLYEMILFRDDWFEEDEIHSISESKIKSMQYEITNADEVINQVNVNFYDRANIKNSSFSISESGLIQTLGRVNAETLDFPYFMNMRNAEIVANWKLKQLSTGAFKGSFTTGWREARKWNRYDLIRLPWSKRWTGTVLVRIMSINLGGPTNNEVSIEYIEVVPSTGMMNTSIVADEPIDKPLPPQACEYEPFEMPYYLAAMRLGQRQVDEELAYESNFGLVGVVAEKPQENSLYAVMMTNNYDEWVRAGSIQYSLTADSDQIISKTSSSFTVENWKKISNVPTGTLIQCGKEWLTGLSEWMVFQSVDHNTGVVSVKRGALDTQPKDWDLGLKLYFCGTDVAYDATEYVAGEKVLVSALTTTPSGVLEQKGSNLVEMKARAIRPYPPANVKINDSYWPETHIITNDIVLTWAHRNRIQQTGGEIIGWYEGDVSAEEGVTYSYELTSGATVLASASGITSNTATIPASSLLPSKVHTLKIWSVRDGYEPYQKFEHSFFGESVSLILSATTSKDKVTGSTVPAANISVNVDESLKANMKFDGSKITGKTQAGATITIEVEE